MTVDLTWFVHIVFRVLGLSKNSLNSTSEQDHLEFIEEAFKDVDEVS